MSRFISMVAMMTGIAVTGSAMAAPVSTAIDRQSWLDGGNAEFIISATDLVNSGQPSLASVAIISGGTVFGGTGLAFLNNGEFAPSFTLTDGLFAASLGTVVEFTLDLNHSPAGYDISSIVSTTWYSGADRAGQAYDVAVAAVGSDTFTPLFSILESLPGNIEPAPNGGIQITTVDGSGGVLASGIERIRVTFNGHNGDGAPESVYAEFDIHGSATVPEPASIALLSIGAAMMLRRRRAC